MTLEQQAWKRSLPMLARILALAGVFNSFSCRWLRSSSRELELIRTLDGGQSWSGRAPRQSEPYELAAVWGTSISELYAGGRFVYEGAGHAGLLLHSRDDGNTWEEAVVDIAITSIWGSSATDVYALGRRDALFHSAGDGRWRRVETPPTGSLNAIWGASASELYIAGDEGVLSSQDAGRSWSRFPTETAISSLWGAANGDIYAAGYRGVVLLSRDRGRTWIRLATGTDEALLRISGTLTGDIYAAGTRVVLRSADRGMTWQSSYLGEVVVTGLWCATNGEVFAVTADGAVRRSIDAGRSWSIQRPPSTTHGASAIWGRDSRLIFVAGGRRDASSNYNIR